MKIKYDEEADVIYLRFGEGKIIESDEIKDGIIIDYDENDNPVAIEILNAKDILANNPEISLDFTSFKLNPNKKILQK